MFINCNNIDRRSKTHVLILFVAMALLFIARTSFAACTPSDTCQSKLCTICGTSGNNTINGFNNVDDVICGLGGNDTIDGKSGNDTICGGDGNDTIHGGIGDDRIIGDAGYDVIFGEANDDIINCTVAGISSQSGEADGGSGNDQIYGCQIAYGGPGVDTINGTPIGDLLYGGDGNDSLFGSNGDDGLDVDASQTGGTDNCNGGGGNEDNCDCETNVNCEN